MQWSDNPPQTPNDGWQKGLQSFEAQPNDQLWHRIETRLDEHNQYTHARKLTVKRYASYASVAAVVCLLALSSVTFWNHQPEQSTVQPLASNGQSTEQYTQKQISTLPENKGTQAVQVEPFTPKSVNLVNPSEKKSAEKAEILKPIPTVLRSSSSNDLKAVAFNHTPVTVVTKGETVLQPSDFYHASLVALGKGQYCTSHYNITMAKMMMCNKDHLHNEVDRMLRVVEDKIASHCLCMAEEYPADCE